MKLRIITGRAGAGKSKLVLETIAAQRFERQQILLVPEHATHEAELDLCRALGDTASRDGEVLSFQSLATRVLSQTGGISDITLDNGGKILIMRRALQEVSSYLTVFSKPSQRPAFLRELVALADELYAYKIAPSLLLQQVQDIPGAAGDKLRSTALLFGAYDARLHGGDFDARSKVQKLCDKLPNSDYLCGKDIYIDGFSYFNRTEEDIIAAALKQANSVTVTLLGDDSDPQLFHNGIQQRERLRRLAKDAGCSCEVETLSGTATQRFHTWSDTSSARKKRGRATRRPSHCIRPTPPILRWSMCLRSCERWHKMAFAGVRWPWRRGIWRYMARCWRPCSAGTMFPPISVAGATFWSSRS